MGSLVFADRVAETTTTTGTGTVTLAGAKTGYQSFAAIADGNQCYYTIAGGSQWEVGIGTYTASGTTLSRDTVLSSSNSGSLVSFSAGTKDVFVDVPASAVSSWIPIAEIVTSASQSSVDFSSIPAYFRSLKIHWSARDTASGTSGSILRLRVNNDSTAANYTSTFRVGTQNTTTFASSVAASTKGVEVGFIANDGNAAGAFSAGEITLPSYADASKSRRILALAHHEEASGGVIVSEMTARYTQTTGINQLTFLTDGTAFKDTSVFTVLGLRIR